LQVYIKFQLNFRKTGINISIDITSSANRGLFQAFYDFPAMINIWVAPIVGEALGSPTREDWRWTYAMISFCILVTSIPLLVGLFRLEHTVKQSGQLEPRKKSEPKPLIEKIKHVLVEIDIVGSLLLVGFLCMILLPLVLATSRWGGWNSSRTIGCLVAGAVSGILFAIWERKFATKPLVPLGKWDTPTPIAGVISCAMISVISASNWTYFITYLQISRRIGNQESTYIDRSYDAAFLISQVGAGYAMKYFKVYRPIVFIGMSLMMIGIGLMIPSRYPDSSTAFVVITQVIAGFGAGMIYVPILVAVQSSVPHQGINLILNSRLKCIDMMK
jgi:MFS family permease